MERFDERGLLRASGDGRTRIDIGTSLGNLGGDQEAFLADAEETHALFATLFEGLIDPVQLLYHHLQALAPDKAVKTACERDGRLYGPAIFRIHYETHSYSPHIDHVVLREKRFSYEVARFTHQFAGVLCVQNADSAGSWGASCVASLPVDRGDTAVYRRRPFSRVCGCAGCGVLRGRARAGRFVLLQYALHPRGPSGAGGRSSGGARRLHWVCRRRRRNLRVVLTRAAVYAHRPRPASDRSLCAARGIGETAGTAARPAGWG